MNHYATIVPPADVADPNDLLAEVAMWPECWRVLRRVRKAHDHRVHSCTWDFDDCGIVGILDLLTLLANWGACA